MIFLTHPLAASSLASWQPGLATSDRDCGTQIAMHRSRIFAIFQFLAPQNYWGPGPHLGTRLKTTFSPYRLVKVL